MHYRHAYHAGNFADVFKHVLLCGLLQALNRKDKPWCYLETHAGAGEYHLGGMEAGKTAEWQDGIGRLSNEQPTADPLKIFLEIARAKTLRYPGSPRFAQALARPFDHLILCEKVPEVFADLRSRIPAELHQRDGYEAHGLLPPKAKRGLVLVDPPFEARDEFDRISEFLDRAVPRFSNGIYAIWYPLKNRHEAERFLRRIQRDVSQPAIDIQFENGAPGEGQMRACGMAIINPPFRFSSEMEPALRVLSRLLAQGPRPQFSIKTLVEENRDPTPPRRSR